MRTYCYDSQKACNKNGCRYWINHQEHNNCCLVMAKNGSSTFEEISKVLKISKTQARLTLNKVVSKLQNLLSKLND